MIGRQLKKFTLIVSMLIFSTFPLFGDAGVPMIMLAYPGMIALLIPIVLIEMLVSARRLKLEFKKTFWFTSVSNLGSTLVGIPLTWLLLVVLQMSTGGGSGNYSIYTPLGKILSVTWQAAWLLPIDSELYWMVPCAMFVLLVPFFFASWLSEFGIAILFLRKSNIEIKSIRKTVFWANAASYGLLALVVAGYFIFSVLTHRVS